MKRLASMILALLLAWCLTAQPVQAAGSVDERKGEPKLMASVTSMNPKTLEAGGEADLTITVRNTNGSRYVKNAIFNFNADGGEIVPVGSASIYVPKLEQGASFNWTIRVRALAAAKSGVHTATVTMDYEDNAHQPHTASSRIYLDIRQPVRLQVGELKFPLRLTHGDTPAFSLTLMNLGQSQIKNALLSFKLDGLTHAGSVLVGTIDPGESKDGMTNFRVESDRTGTIEGVVTIDYEDDFGQHYTTSVPLKTTIEPRVAPKAPEVQKPLPAAGPLTRWLLPAVGAVLLLMLIASAWLIRNARQRQKDEARL